MSLSEPHAVPLPPESRISAVYAEVNLADAFAIDLPPGTARSPEVLARFVFAHQPRLVSVLMRIRDALVGGFGLKTASSLSSVGAAGSRIGIFKVYEANSVEVIVGEDDKHLDSEHPRSISLRRNLAQMERVWSSPRSSTATTD